MRAWFAKLRMSAALDDCRNPVDRSQRKTDVSDELRGFERELAVLDRALKQTAPRPQTPPSLHCSIMRALQATERPAAKAGLGLALLRWLPVPVVTVLAVMVVWHAARGPVRMPVRDTQPLAAATTALEVGGEMARAVPSSVVTPLADELKKINLDLDNTAQFLLASLP